MPMKLLLESAHVVLGGEFFAGGVEDAHLLVVGSGSLLVLGGAPTGVAPGKDGDDGGQRQQRCGAGQYPRGGQHGGILLTNSHVPPCTAWVLPHLSPLTDMYRQTSITSVVTAVTPESFSVFRIMADRLDLEATGRLDGDQMGNTSPISPTIFKSELTA